MNTVAVMPSICAASATPCAWLPALAATTPRGPLPRVEPGDPRVRAADLERPGALQVLALQQHGTAAQLAQRPRVRQGVGATTPASSSRAARTSAGPTGGGAAGRSGCVDGHLRSLPPVPVMSGVTVFVAPIWPRAPEGVRMTRVRDIAPLVAAAALAVGAVVAARTAGCDDPGHYEVRSWGYELVGGCIAPGDIVVPNPAPAPKPATRHSRETDATFPLAPSGRLSRWRSCRSLPEMLGHAAVVVVRVAWMVMAWLLIVRSGDVTAAPRTPREVAVLTWCGIRGSRRSRWPSRARRRRPTGRTSRCGRRPPGAGRRPGGRGPRVDPAGPADGTVRLYRKWRWVHWHLQAHRALQRGSLVDTAA